MTTPPLGPEQGWNARACQRELGPGWVGNLCDLPGRWHLIWDPTAENSVACDRHAVEASTHRPAGFHPLDGDCTMPGTVWDSDNDRCRFPGFPTVAADVSVLAEVP
jgi:hypothetical protein